MGRYKIVSNGKAKMLESLPSDYKLSKSLSVIIPTYNEEKNINQIVSAVRTALSLTKYSKSYEIIIADDNSKDGTPKAMDSLAKSSDVIAFHRYKDRGIFSAELDALKVSSGKKFLTMDADFSHKPELIPILLSFAEKYDIVSASRFAKGGGMNAPKVRVYGSKFLNNLCALIIGVKVKDMGGNFRLFDKKKFLRMKFRYPAVFGEFGFEIFKRAKDLNYSVKEVPFTYEFRREGKSKMGNLMKYGVAYIKMALRLRFEKS